MKILQVNCVYAKGSTGKIVADIHNVLLSDNIESIVLYGRGQKSNDPLVVKTCGEFYSHINNFLTRISGVMYGGCFLSTNRLIKIIKQQQPDIVHLHCINGYFVNIYRLINWLKKNKIKTILTLHAEFMFTANCGHAFDCEKWKTGCGHCSVFKNETHSLLIDNTHKSWLKMKKAYDGFDNLVITSVSPWLMERAKQSPFFINNRQFVTLNGLDTNVFHYYEQNEIREELKLVNEKVIFHATPNFNDNKEHIKGGYYIIEVAKRLKEYKFVIAGKYPENLIVPSNVILLGQINDQKQLAKLYSMANLTIITSKKETFSMITSESLSCGTPIVGFKAGGPETISIDKYSCFVEYGDINGLIDKIKEFIYKDFNKKEISEESKIKYSKESMCKEYMNIYNSML